MSIRLTGMASNLDTDSMVQELVKASSAKKETLEKEQTALGWKQKAWSDLNTKIYNFFNKTLDNMKYQGSYGKKSTTIADTSIATVVAGDSAVNGSQKLAVTQLATSGYLTGGKLSGSNTASTTMAGLGAIAEGETAAIDVNGTTININGSTTIQSFVSQLNDAGVNASFDATNQRFFISAKESGADADFTIAAHDANGLKALQNMKLMTAGDATNNSDYIKWANMTDEELAAEATTESAKRANAFYNSVLSLQSSNEELQKEKEKLAAKKSDYLASDVYKNAMKETDPSGINTLEDNLMLLKDKISTIEEETKSYAELSAKKEAGETLTAEEEAKLAELSTDEKKASWASLDTYKKNLNTLQTCADYDTSMANIDTTIATNNTTIADYQKYYNTTMDAEGKVTANATDLMKNTVQTEFENKRTTAKEAIAAANGMTGDLNGAARIAGQDAKIQLNGAEFTSKTNSFTVNGLTITANALSDISSTTTKYYDADGNEVPEGTAGATAKTTNNYKTTAINTTDDVDGIYKMIKNFFSEYNTLINEMDSLYNASSSKGYQPLTSEEKDSMTDTEVEAWEKKIKDALLRKDSTLGTTISNMKMSMMSSFTVDGKTTSLSDYGIETLGYFLAADNEKGAYHIAGDSTDTNTSEAEDKLKTAIANDPSGVVSFFTQLSTALHGKLNTQMGRTTYSSFKKVYEDKKMQEEYDGYTTKIAAQEKKLTALEDRYYSQFTAMEVAMSKLNSQQSSLSSLLG